MVAVFLLLESVDVTYSNKPQFCCEGVQKIVQLERFAIVFMGDFIGCMARSFMAFSGPLR